MRIPADGDEGWNGMLVASGARSRTTKMMRFFLKTKTLTIAVLLHILQDLTAALTHVERICTGAVLVILQRLL